MTLFRYKADHRKNLPSVFLVLLHFLILEDRLKTVTVLIGFLKYTLYLRLFKFYDAEQKME